MQIVMTSYFGEGSGVFDDIIGQVKSTMVFDDSDKLLLVGEILSCIAQGTDINLTFVNE